MAQAYVDSMYTAYVNWTNELEPKILEYLDPTGNYKLSPTPSYPLSSLSAALLVAMGYLAMVGVGMVVTKAGAPKLNVRGLQFLYNPLQVALCSYMCLEAAGIAFHQGYSLSCAKFVPDEPPMAKVLWLFYVSKIFDFCDTFFIIAAQKWNQLSFLHVYHHFSVYLIYWMNLRVAYDGDAYLAIVLNGGIHVIMYLYYFVSHHTKNIWWKKYLTTLQLIQFGCMNLHGLVLFLGSCQEFPPRAVMFYIAYTQTLFWLFVHFYVQAYRAKTKTR